MKLRFPLKKDTIISVQKEDVVYRLLNLLLLSGIGLFCVGNYLGIQSLDWISVLQAMLILLCVTFFRQATVPGRILIAVGLMVVLFAVGIIVGFQNYGLFFKAYFQWLMNQPPWEPEWVRGYEAIQILFLVVICYLLQWLTEKDFWVKVCLALVLLGGLFYCLFSEKKLAHTGVVFLFVYLLFVCVEVIQRRWNKVKRRDTSAYIVWVTPFLAIYLVVMLLMPLPEKPYDWQVFKNIYHQLQESFRTISQNFIFGNGEEYAFTFSGFSEKGGFGGEIFNNEREVMTIQCERGLKTNIYLIGKVFDTFDGREWVQLNEETDKERYIDTIETLYAVERYDEQYIQDYLSSVKLKIRYNYFRSSYVFAPLKTRSLQQEGESLYHHTSGGSILFEETKGYGTEYEAVFYQMNAAHPVFMEFLNAESEPDEEKLQSRLSDINKRSDEEITAEDLQNHQKNIEKYYMGQDGLSDGVREYLDRILKDAESDVEKLKAIEEELASFVYTQAPGELPDSVTNSSEFLDYFLLESRQGYCSYFATAFVLLARAEGIPARFVQGFCVPMYDNNEVVVYSDMAHAWPEVYLKGIGWIPFEPTPGYAQFRYTPWKTVNKENGTLTGGNYANNQSAGAQGMDNLPENGHKEEIADADGKITLEYLKDLRRILLVAVILFLALAILILLLYRLIHWHRYQKMDEFGRYQIEVERVLRILVLLKLKRHDDETIEELRQRVNEELKLQVTLSFWEGYEATLYGDKKADSEMLQVIIEEKKILLQVLRERRKVKYWIERIICN